MHLYWFYKLRATFLINEFVSATITITQKTSQTVWQYNVSWWLVDNSLNLIESVYSQDHKYIWKSRPSNDMLNVKVWWQPSYLPLYQYYPFCPEITSKTYLLVIIIYVWFLTGYYVQKKKKQSNKKINKKVNISLRTNLNEWLCRTQKREGSIVWGTVQPRPIKDRSILSIPSAMKGEYGRLPASLRSCSAICPCDKGRVGNTAADSTHMLSPYKNPLHIPPHLHSKPPPVTLQQPLSDFWDNENTLRYRLGVLGI